MMTAEFTSICGSASYRIEYTYLFALGANHFIREPEAFNSFQALLMCTIF